MAKASLAKINTTERAKETMAKASLARSRQSTTKARAKETMAKAVARGT